MEILVLYGNSAEQNGLDFIMMNRFSKFLIGIICIIDNVIGCRERRLPPLVSASCIVISAVNVSKAIVELKRWIDSTCQYADIAITAFTLPPEDKR